jgi:O-antigen/teichoic acid export membrane protein
MKQSESRLANDTALRSMPNSAGSVESGASPRELDRSLVRGIAWTGGTKWTGQAVGWAATLVVAHILNPRDYGIYSVATLYLGLLTLLAEFGIGTAILVIRNLSHEEIAEINTLALSLGALGFAISCAAARSLAAFFHQPALVRVVVSLAAGFAFSSLQSVPLAILQRGLKFKRLGVFDLLRSLTVASVSIVLAWNGFAYWTLVLASLTGTVLFTVLIFTASPVGLRLPSKQTLSKVAGFNSALIMSRLAWYGYSNADFLVAGRMFGSDVLGVYTMAWTLATMPLEKLHGVLGSVTTAQFSAVQNDHAQLRRYLLGLTGSISLIIFPLLAGLAVTAPNAVAVVLGAKWTPSVPSLQVLAIYGCLRCAMPLLPSLLVAMGDVRYTMWISIASAALFPLGFFVAGRHYGIVGIAFAWVLLYPLNAASLLLRVRKKVGLRLADYVREMREPAIACMTMMAAVLAVYLVPALRSHIRIELTVQVLTGVLVYVGVMYTIGKRRLRSLSNALGMLKR